MFHELVRDITDQKDTAVGIIKEVLICDVNEQYTNGIIINETSVTTNLIKSHEYLKGGMVKGKYPKNIQSEGYHGKFVHQNIIPDIDGDFAGIVYRSKNSAGELYDWVFAWYNSFDHQTQPNTVYTDILKPQTYPNIFWDEVLEKLKQGPAQMSTRKFQCQSDVSIDFTLPANFTAKLSTYN